MERIEATICGFRRELKISGLPEDRHAWELAAHLGERLIVEVNPLPLPYTLPGTPAVVTLPAGWSERRQARALLHEIGHVLCCDRTPAHLVGEDLRADRLLRLWEGREETRARLFVLCWLLPAEWLLSRLCEDLETLASAAGVTTEEIRSRLAALLRG